MYAMHITAIRLDRLTLPLEPAFEAAWDPVPRRSFGATIVRVETDAGVVGVGSGDTMDGFAAYEHLFIGRDPLAIRARVLQSRRHGQLGSPSLSDDDPHRQEGDHPRPGPHAARRANMCERE